MSTIGIHGFGRIGRAIFRSSLTSSTVIGGVNDRCEDGNLVYLLRHDSLAGPLAQTLTVEDGNWRVADRLVQRSAMLRIDEVPWADFGIDTVIDASGSGSRKEWDAAIERGLKSIVVTHHEDQADLTIIAGVNDAAYDPTTHRIISASTCDANAAALVLDALAPLGIVTGSMLTLHPWLGYQNLLDGPISSEFPPDHRGDYSMGRSAGINLIPKKTSLVAALGAVLPDLASHLMAMSYRVPTAVVSCLNLDLVVSKPTSSDDINQLIRTRADAIGGQALQCNDDPLVSTDFRASCAGATVDTRWTELSDEAGVVRLVAWYDNEVGYGHQVLRVLQTLDRAAAAPPPSAPSDEARAG
jgi:glyceraldehyde 3-phosphate dehydrogenase